MIGVSVSIDPNLFALTYYAHTVTVPGLPVYDIVQ